jgi:peptidoglycan/LPS O-acetylase OafA/YrhL
LSVLFFSALMFLFIEKPCMDRLWPHKFFEWAKKLPQLVAKFYFN